VAVVGRVRKGGLCLDDIAGLMHYSWGLFSFSLFNAIRRPTVTNSQHMYIIRWSPKPFYMFKTFILADLHVV